MRKLHKKINTSGDIPPLNPVFASLVLDDLPEFQGSLEKVKNPEKNNKKGRVVLRKETSQRAGKAVIVVSQFESKINLCEIDELARALKKACGCGGTVKEREIEVQGDQPAKVRAFLEDKGFRVDGVR